MTTVPYTVAHQVLQTLSQATSTTPVFCQVLNGTIADPHHRLLQQMLRHPTTFGIESMTVRITQEGKGEPLFTRETLCRLYSAGWPVDTLAGHFLCSYTLHDFVGVVTTDPTYQQVEGVESCEAFLFRVAPTLSR